MRLIAVCLVMALAPLASAHTLDGDATPFEQLAHQFSSGHHLPMILLAAVAAVLAIRTARNRHRR